MQATHEGAYRSRTAATRSSRTALLFVALCAATASAGAGTLQQDIVFSDYAARAGASEIVHRFLSPLAAGAIDRKLQGSDTQLSHEPLDLAAERFTVYVPAAVPPGGYALLVFIPPWPQAYLPHGWDSILDRHGMIFVTAARSGNDANILTRRVPLALLAAENVMRRYPIDPQRVYIGGFSGGSRVAERVVVGYPDLFRGALLNASSDTIDGSAVVAPPAELLQRLQESVRLVYVTGERDQGNLDRDARSVQSMRKWCVYDIDTQVTFGAAHEPMKPTVLEGALRALATHAKPDAARLTACRAALQKDVAEQLQRVETLLASGQREQAQKQLTEVDKTFGGLAAPRSLELESALGWEVH